MSAGVRTKWDVITDMSATEFLNYFAYLSDKAKYEKQVMEESKREWKSR